MKYLAVLLAFFIGGCANTGALWHGDRSFTADERDKIEDANTFIAKKVHRNPYHIVWDGEPVPDGGTCKVPFSVVRGGKTNPYGGYWYDKERCAYLDVRAADFAGLAAHELGHSRGLPHLQEGVKGLMNEFVGPMVWTDADEVSCKRNLVCPK